uniref:Uncharacterized protein n=1 Tax=Caenorhabditis japonica TaxID=281687 RepID=A0A8R1IFN5_CAEJA
MHYTSESRGPPRPILRTFRDPSTLNPHQLTFPSVTRNVPFHFERIRVDPEEKGGGVSVEPFPGPSLLPGTLIRNHSASHYVRHLIRAPSSASHPSSPLVHHRRPRTIAPPVVSRLHADRALSPGGLLDHFE